MPDNEEFYQRQMDKMSETRLFPGEQKCLHRYSGSTLCCVLPYGHSGQHQYPEAPLVKRDARPPWNQTWFAAPDMTEEIEGQVAQMAATAEIKREREEHAVTDESAAQYAQTKPVWSLRVFENLPLPLRMRAAATVLDEAHQRNDTDGDWCADNLRKCADKWEKADIEKAKRATLVKELATLLRNGVAPSRGMWQQATLDDWNALAHTLLDAGWRKETDGV